MNEAEITKFLAETVMGWVTMDDWSENPFVDNDSAAIFVDEPNDVAHLDFDPIRGIEHAWMVVEKMQKDIFSFSLKWYADGNVHVDFTGITPSDDGEAGGVNVQKAICIAAVRARASEEQIEELL